MWNQVALGLGPTDFNNALWDNAVFVDVPQTGNWPTFNGVALGSCNNCFDSAAGSDSPNPATNPNNNKTTNLRVPTINLQAVDFAFGNDAWNQFISTTFMHEVGHSLGAVQYSAPFSDGSGHCKGPLSDSMCLSP